MIERIDVTPIAGLDVQTGLLLAMLDDGTQELRGELGDVADETLVWQPFPNGHSIGTLILHIADVEAKWLHEVGAGLTRSSEELAVLLSSETRQYQYIWPAPPAQPLSWFLARHDEIRARTHTLIKTLSGSEHLGSRINRRTGERHEFTLRQLLHHVLTHEAYHGGQAVLLSVLHERTAKTVQ